MRRRPVPVLVLLTATLVGGCETVRETAGRAEECSGLVRDVASAGLSGTPSAADAEAAAQRLDERVSSIDDAQLREAAGTLRDRLQELADSAGRADPAAARQAADQAREAGRAVAQTCGVPVDQILGG